MAAANLVLATVCIVLAVTLFVDYYSVINSGQPYDIEVLNGPYFAVLVLVPVGGLLTIAAAAHWWRWPVRWLFQGLAIVLPAVFAFLLLSH